jgi:glycosyltransferase involved in cell wall biosynthesis
VESPAKARAAERPRVSGLVIVLDGQARLAACLASLSWCDEILVVDSFSTDRTEAIARSFPNVRFVQHAYHGAGPQRSWAIPQCRHPWVIALDHDEVCSPALRDEVLEAIARPDAPDAYVVRRAVWFLDRRIRHCGWHRDRVARVFRRDECRWQNRRVHARLVTRRDPRPAVHHCPVLRNPLEHHMVDSVAEYVERSRKYGYWAAAQDWRDGKRTRLRQVIDGPLWRFFRTYVLLGGFLDGAPGLVFCACQAMATFSKRASLWGWQYNAARGVEPDLPSFEPDAGIFDLPPAAPETAAR